MRELVSVKKLNKLSELKVAALDLHIIYSQGVAKELVDVNQKFSSETFITFTKVCPCCSSDLNIHVFLYEKQLIPLKLRYILPNELESNKLENTSEKKDNSSDSSSSPCLDQVTLTCNEMLAENDTEKPILSTLVTDNSSINNFKSQAQTLLNQADDENKTVTNCNICNKELPVNEKVLYHHLYYHQKTQIFKCNLCQKKMINKKRTVDDHVATHAVKDGKPFSCHYCRSSFTSRMGIKNHLLNIHAPPDIREFVCTDCPSKKFTSKISLEKHSKSCHFSKKCPHCDQNFKASNLRRHIDTAHMKKEYRCRQCDVVCHAKDSLRSHIRRVHNTATASKFQCLHCEKSFADRSRYKRHQMIHDDIREHCCPHCSKRFRERSNLESHLRTHSGLKPFDCGVCSKKFADRGSYRNHVKSHEKATGLFLDKSVKKFKSHKM